MTTPVLNITMPVYNRYELTQKSLLALRKCSQRIPFTITVVDNGSDSALVEKLIEFKDIGIIDKLFLLNGNMGISCAANIGWDMTDAPFYMKLDNDIVIKDPNFFSIVFALWSHGEPLSTLGGTPREQFLANPGTIRTRDGVLGICEKTLAGYAIFIPKQVSDILGVWSEDYGLYGAEDGDYGLRMNCVGFKQYYYCQGDLMENLGNDLASTYVARDFDKRVEKKKALVRKEGEFGLFMINQALYNLCIRTWKPVRRYKVVDISSKYAVRLEENEEFAHYKTLLDACTKKINGRIRKFRLSNPDYIFVPEFIEELKVIMRSGGYDCDGFLRQQNG